jgi:hypothetical protein
MKKVINIITSCDECNKLSDNLKNLICSLTGEDVSCAVKRGDVATDCPLFDIQSFSNRLKLIFNKEI